MAFLQVYNNESELILNTPNRKEILKEGPPQNSKCNILGRGAYGTVFKAIFRAKQVAVKIVKNLNLDINSQSMRNESNILGWKHRNIVKILKIESTPKFGIVIMERFPGQCLQMVLDSVDLPMLHRVYISFDILSALIYCHKRCLLHLDVKPQNVLISFGRSGQNLMLSIQQQRTYICKLCDFGSSMQIGNLKENTTKGIAKGTVRYMSPEALREEPLTSAADIYSLGITMWQLQHRQLPYNWIACNEIVAYQVVKTDLRPDFVVSLCSGTNVVQNHRKCFCRQVASQMSYQSLEHIKNLLNQHSDFEKDDDLGLNILLQHKCNQKVRPLSRRRPFQALNSQLLSNSSEVRDAHSELGTDVSADDNLYNWSAIFTHTSCLRNLLKEAAYEALYKSCWDRDFQYRPKANELRMRLKQLL